VIQKLLMGSKSIQYSDFGDNYEQKDPLKVLAIKSALSTSDNLKQLGYKEVTQSRGESTHVIDVGPFYLVSNPEGLGTKNLIADIVNSKQKGKSFYQALAKDTVASIVNDLITLGGRALVISAHWSMGNNDVLKYEQRWKDLVKGWRDACNECGAIYGAGESPTLRGILMPGKIELSGSAVGIINPKKRLTLGNRLKVGDHIVLIESNGLHANGVSMARGLAEKLPKKYSTILANGKKLGEQLLKPSHIYAKLQNDLFEAGVDIHYMVHITGHGWSKLMRYVEREFTYRINTLPDVQEEFKVLQKVGKLTDEAMYGAFNMGAGFAFYVPKDDVEKVQKLAKSNGFKSWDAGIVEEGKRQVIIEPLNLIYGAEMLKLR
jgi:phosphoribosylformylglycinamidine cyclo-ligase